MAQVFDAVVGDQFTSVTEALAAAPSGTGPYRIKVLPGTYREKVTVHRPGVTLVGSGPETTKIVWGDRATGLGPDGVPLGTFRTQTLEVLAPDFRAEGLTVSNDWDYSTEATQAVAVKTDGEAARVSFVGCWLEGHQDTLYANAGTQHYLNCRISGHTDYIFGAGQAVFEDCDIVTLERAGNPVGGWVIAPSTKEGVTQGFLFVNCRLLKDPKGLAPGSVYLGRPWHPSFAPDTTNVGVFRDCWLDDHIHPDGWDSMGSRPGGVYTLYYPQDAQLFEFRSSGPGAVSAPTPVRRFLTDQEAQGYTKEGVLGSWTGATRT